jgi:hypothetical protein
VNKRNVIKLCNEYLGLIFILLFMVMSFLLVESGKILEARYLPLIFSPLLGFSIVRRLSDDSNAAVQLSKNVHEAQKLIAEKSYGIFRYVERKQAVGDGSPHGVEDFRMTDLISTPIVWVLCLLVALMLYINPIYLDFDNGDFSQKAKLVLSGFLQLMFFAVSFGGMAISIKNRSAK